MIFLLLIICALAQAQPIRFQRTYGFSGHDNLRAKQTPDGGYILYGHKYYNSATEDILIIKTDSTGAITWARTYGTSMYDYIWDLEILNNSYLICGTSANWLTYPTGGFFLKIDNAGNILWVKTSDFMQNLVRTQDGGFAITSPGGLGIGYLTKLDSNLDMVWRKKYTLDSLAATVSLRTTFDGGFLIAGTMFGFNNSLDFNLIRTDSLGNILWAKMYGGDSAEWFPKVEPTFDGGCIMVGTTQSFGIAFQDVLLLKIDAIGNVQWTKTYGGVFGENGNMVKPTLGSLGYILTGTTQGFTSGDSANAFNTRTFLIKTDINGNVQWARRYGLGPMDDASNVWETDDGGYAFSGITAGIGGYYDGWLIKTDNTGSSGCNDWPTMPFVTSPTIRDSTLSFTETSDTLIIGIGTVFDSIAYPTATIICLNVPGGIGDENTNQNGIEIFPNPTNGILNINTREIKNATEVFIYNSIGQMIFSEKLRDTQTSLQMSSYPSGIYFVRVLTKDNEVLCKKIIKE